MPRSQLFWAIVEYSITFAGILGLLLLAALSVAIVVSAVAGGLSVLVLRASGVFPCTKRLVWTAMLVSVSAGFVAVFIGYLTGISREPAVSAILSAVVTAIAGFAVLFRDIEGGKMLTGLIAVMVFVASLAFGTLVGSGVRYDGSDSLDARLRAVEDERRIRFYRENLGLEPESSKENQ